VAEYDSVIPAGKSGTLTAKIKTVQGRTLQLTKSISVTTDCEAVPTLRLTAKLKAVSPIEVTPKQHVSLSSIVGEKKAQQLLVRRADGKPLTLSVTEIKPEGLVTVTTEAAAANAGEQAPARTNPGEVAVDVELIPQSSAVNQNGQITLTTNVEKQQQVQIPFVVRVREALEAIPAHAYLFVAPQKEQPTRAINVNLRQNARESFSVSRVTVSDPELVTARLVTEGERHTHAIKVELAQGVDLQSLKLPFVTTLKIETSVHQRPVVVVPVTVQERVIASRGAQSGRVRRARPAPSEK